MGFFSDRGEGTVSPVLTDSDAEDWSRIPHAFASTEGDVDYVGLEHLLTSGLPLAGLLTLGWGQGGARPGLLNAEVGGPA